jgi:calcineurin-like phosphoesterase family protein
MNEALISNYNAFVGQKDLVYILGDFAWKRHRHFVSRLHGKKILISGTHDKMDQVSRQQFSEVIGRHRQPGILELVLEKQLVVLSHYPLGSWLGSVHGRWHFHGHAHGRVPESDAHLRCDVGVDVWAYMPVPWEVLKLKMEEKQELWHAQRKEVDSSAYDYNEALQPIRATNRAVYQRCINAGRLPAQTVNVYTELSKI